MFVYSCSIKIWASGFEELLERIFCLLLVVEVFSLQKIVKMLEEGIVGWWEVRWTWWMRQNLMRHPLMELFHLSNLLQIPNEGRMANIQFFCNSSCKGIIFDHCSQLVIVNFWRPATVLLIFKSLLSFAKFLESPLHCMFVSSSWAKCVVDVVSCPQCFIAYLNSNKNTSLEFAFLSNIISIVYNKYKINSK